MYRIKTPFLDITATKGCAWLVEPALTVRMNGYMDGLGHVTKGTKGHTLEIDVETYGWDKDTGEMNTVTWTFHGDSTLAVMAMLKSMVARARDAELQEQLFQPA